VHVSRPEGAGTSRDFQNKVGDLEELFSPQVCAQAWAKEDVVDVGSFLSRYTEFVDCSLGGGWRGTPQKPRVSGFLWDPHVIRIVGATDPPMTRCIPFRRGKGLNSTGGDPRLQPMQ